MGRADLEENGPPSPSLSSAVPGGLGAHGRHTMGGRRASPSSNASSLALRRQILKVFKINGLNVQADAVKALISVLQREEDKRQALDLILSSIKAKIEKQEYSSALITLDVVTEVVMELSENQDEVEEQSIQVFDAFSCPRLCFDTIRKRFYLDDLPKKLHGKAEERTQLFRHRFKLLMQRIKRNKNFSAPVISSASAEYLELTPLESLAGSNGIHCVVGMLIRKERNMFYLEDLSATVPVDLSQAQFAAGLLTEMCVVLAEGRMADGLFHIQSLGFPPAESRADTLEVLGQLDPLGLRHTKKRITEMQELESQALNSMFVILSDVHLDNEHVMEKLRRLFEGFSQCPPQLFVLMGDFSSEPVGQGSLSPSEYCGLFRRLSALIGEFPSLQQNSTFCFIPGPQDPSFNQGILPRGPLPSYFTQEIRSRLPHAHFCSNPVRVRFYTQEIVFFRENLLNKLRRHCVLPPPTQTPSGEALQATDHLVKTIVEQSHLCPLPLTVTPVHWAYDHALCLTPLPDVVVLADYIDQYHNDASGPAVFNPGSFFTDFSFVVYRPATRETEFSRV